MGVVEEEESAGWKFLSNLRDCRIYTWRFGLEIERARKKRGPAYETRGRRSKQSPTVTLSSGVAQKVEPTTHKALY